jgi:hypothetical protein
VGRAIPEPATRASVLLETERRTQLLDVTERLVDEAWTRRRSSVLLRVR